MSFTVVMSSPLRAEVHDTLLNKPYFVSRISRSVADQWLMLIDRQAELTTIPTEVPRAASHAEDDLILATAVSGSAAYLVTGDQQLQRLGTFEGIAIVSPAEFLSVLSGPRE